MHRVILSIGAGAKALAALSLPESKRDVGYWHKADMLFALRNVRLRVRWTSVLLLGESASTMKRTSLRYTVAPSPARPASPVGRPRRAITISATMLSSAVAIK